MDYTDNKRGISGRDGMGRFTEGNQGRPKGARGKTSRAALEQVKSMQEGAMQKLWEAVQAKERWAVEFVLSKVLPGNRTIEFEGITPGDIGEALQAGDISPDEAKSISAAIKNIREMEDIEKIQERLKELEEAVGNGG